MSDMTWRRNVAHIAGATLLAAGLPLALAGPASATDPDPNKPAVSEPDLQEDAGHKAPSAGDVEGSVDKAGESADREGGNVSPPGGNGTIKIHDEDVDLDDRRNVPHVCQFTMDAFNFDSQQKVEWLIREWAPTAGDKAEAKAAEADAPDAPDAPDAEQADAPGVDAPEAEAPADAPADAPEAEAPADAPEADAPADAPERPDGKVFADDREIVKEGDITLDDAGEGHTDLMSLQDGHFKLFWTVVKENGQEVTKHKVFWVGCTQEPAVPIDEVKDSAPAAVPDMPTTPDAQAPAEEQPAEGADQGDQEQAAGLAHTGFSGPLVVGLGLLLLIGGAVVLATTGRLGKILPSRRH
ncbi:MAG: hypothetical protein ACRDPT_06925 [Streptomycetales bacterium]